MKKLMVVVVGACASLVSFAYNWSGATGVVTLTETAVVTDADLEVVTNLTGIVLQGAETDLIFNNATVAATLKGTITGDGRIVKRGAAAVFFGKPHTTAKMVKDKCPSGWADSYQDYYTTGGISVETGDLWFPQDGAAKACYGPISVNAGATLHIHPDSATCILALNGAGKVSNGRAWTCWEASDSTLSFFVGYYGSEDVSDFTGTFEGNFAPVFCGNVRIHGPDTDRAAMASSIYRNAFSSREIGVLRVNKFGNRPPSSYRYYGPDDKDLSAFASPLGIGTSYYYGVDYDVNYGGRLIYEGSGETTDRRFRFGGTYCPEYTTFDAGATGGLNFTGEIRSYGTDRYYGAVLSGSNTVEVTVSGTVAGASGRIHYIKSGSGTWNWMPKTRDTLEGAFFVVNGTLKFPTLTDIGVDCAFGVATNCWKTTRWAELPSYWNNPANRLDCEMVLGDWNAGGTNFPALAYTGAAQASSNRRIGLIGVGGTIANTDAAGSLQLTGGVSPRTLAQVRESTDESVTAKTLCLEAVGDGNAVGPVEENAAGTLNLVKTGPGTWSIKKDFAIHGDIDVREGVLSFEQRGLVPYTWYRYTITQMNNATDTGNSQYPYQRQLGLFDKDGNRLATGLTFVGPDPAVYKTWHEYAGNYDWTKLEPGQVTMGEYTQVHGTTRGIVINREDMTPAELFVDSTSYLRGVTAYLCKYGSASYYFPIVFRLPEGSATPRYYDIVQHNGCGAVNHVGAFRLEGLVETANGREWKLLSEVTECTHRSNTQWFSTGVDVVNGQNQNCRTPGAEFGYEIATGTEDKEVLDLSVASSIKISRGATLQVLLLGGATLPKLTVDCAGEGVATVKGFKIAETGVLTLANAPKGEVKLPVSFADCTDLKNLEGWTATVEGSTKNRYTIEVSDGEVTLKPFGMAILIR